MSFRRCVLVLGSGLILAALLALPASAAGQAAPTVTPSFMLPLASTTGPACPALAGQPATPAPGADPLDLNPLDSSQNLCTHPPCPTGQLYDCICMVCHGRCRSGYFWDDSVCACAPI